MEGDLRSFKLSPLAYVLLKDPKKAKFRHYKHTMKVLGQEATPFHPSVVGVCHFLKHFFELSTTEFDITLLFRFKNQLKNLRLLRIIKLETENPPSSRQYKKIFRWCPLVRNLSMMIPYKTVPCLRLTRKVATLDISIPTRPFEKPRFKSLGFYLQKLSLLQNLVIEVARVPLVDIFALIDRLPMLRTLGLQGIELDLPKPYQKIEAGHLQKSRD